MEAAIFCASVAQQAGQRPSVRSVRAVTVMLRSTINLLAILACTRSALADNSLTLKFENLNVNLVNFCGQLSHCEPHHVFPATDGSPHEGIIPQGLDGSTAPPINRVNVGRNQLDVQQRQPGINGPCPAPGVTGIREIKPVLPAISPTHLAVERITHHDDRRGGQQVGRTGNIATSPLWFQNACLPGLSPGKRIDSHRLKPLRDAMHLQEETHHI